MKKSLKSVNFHIWNGDNFGLTELILVKLLFIHTYILVLFAVRMALTSRGANLFFLTMLRQHSQYDIRLGSSFRVLVMVRVRLGLGLELVLGLWLGSGLWFWVRVWVRVRVDFRVRIWINLTLT